MNIRLKTVFVNIRKYLTNVIYKYTINISKYDSSLRAPGTRDSVTCKRYEKGLLFKT